MDIRNTTFGKAWAAGMFIIFTAIFFQSLVEARPSVGLDLTLDPTSSTTLLAKITLVADPGDKIQAAGLELIYPSDRVAFKGMDEIDGVVLKTGLSKGKGVLTVGLVDVSGHERLDLTLHFALLQTSSTTCIPMVINPEGLENDIKNASISAVRAYCPERPSEVDMWSNPDETANLFLIVPSVRNLKSASIFYGATDVTAALGVIGSYFYDPIKDVLFYILPGISLPAGQYPLTINWDYGQGQKSETVSINVLGSN